jgi:DNA-formamidopyrimidine glycosylase
MPELPEVETVRRTLEGQIIGKKITNIEIYYDKILENTSVEKFKKSLIGQTFRKIDRYGKYLLFILDDYTIISHLRMEGKFFLKTLNDERIKHEHIIFTLDEKISFRYHDTRKFGKMAVLETIQKTQIMEYPALAKLGKEANDEMFSKNELYNLLQKKQEPIKGALLNQEIICGLGNIYVDEVCFMSKIDPKMPSNKITLEDANNILESSKKVLAKAIEAGGTTIRSYTSSLGITGLFQLELLVHSKEKQPCPVCGTIIKKEFVCGRGTYFCSNCQKRRGPKVIGITGSIATGKSTVTHYLKKQGYQVIDADEIVKEAKMKKTSIYKGLVKELGSTILNEKQEIDDAVLSKMIYNDDQIRQKINHIVHPLVYDICQKKINLSKDKVIFLSVPLLFEAGFEKLCDEIWCVYTNSEVQLDRLMKRNHLAQEEAEKMIQSQMPLDEKCQKATFIIDNSDELCYTIEQIQKILK